MTIEETLTVGDQTSWREWLARNHQTAREVWLIFFKKGSGKTGISYDEALEEALRFGWIDGGLRSIDKERYMVRYTPRRTKSIWSRRNREKAELLITQGKMRDEGLAKIEEAKRNGLWEAAYVSGTRAEIPPDLETTLSANKTAWNIFNQLANSYRNMYIRWLDTARTEETRKKRITEIIRRVQLNKKARYGG